MNGTKTDIDVVNGMGEAMTSVTTHEGPVEVPLKSLVGLKHMPNIYFHVSMAYAILRMEGIPSGKGDWLRPVFLSEGI